MFVIKTGYQHPSEALCFSPDGRFLAVNGRTKSGLTCIQIWDLTTRQIAHILLEDAYKFKQVLFTPNGHFIIASTKWGGVWIAEIQTEKTYHLVDTEAECYAALDQNNRLIVSTGMILRDPIALKMWNIENPLEPDLFWHVTNKMLANFACRAVLFTPDRESFLSLEKRGYPAPSLQRLVLRNLHHGQLIREISGLSPQKTFLGLGVTHSSNEITLVEENEIIFRNIENKEHTSTLRKPQGGAFIDFLAHPNCQAFVSLHRLRGVVNVWNAQSMQVTRSYEWPTKKGASLAISPDGLMCAIGDSQGTVVVWDWDE